MKDFKISGSQDLKNAFVEPNLAELRTNDYACPQSHRYSRRTVTVDGMNYQVINITPTSLDFIPKKAKDLLAYLINGS